MRLSALATLFAIGAAQAQPIPSNGPTSNLVITVSSGTASVTGPSGTLWTMTDPGSAVASHMAWTFSSGTNRWTLAPSAAANLALAGSGGGNVIISPPINLFGLGTIDPHVAGQLWSNAGVITMSSG